MSFVYIDSQDREVKIPSVDALRLRIELGAIKDQTRFFDGNTAKWAPAAEHEIYRTLKRELSGAEQGFVAPPPPSVPSAEAPTLAPPGNGVVAEGTASPDTPEGAVDGSNAEDRPTEETLEPEETVEPNEEAEVEEAVTESPTDEFAGSGFEGFEGVEVASIDEGSEEESTDAAPAEEESFIASAGDELMGDLDPGAGSELLDDDPLDLEPSLADSFAADVFADPHAGSDPLDDFGHGSTSGADPAVEAGWTDSEPETGDPAPEGSSTEDAFDGVWESPEDHRPEPTPDPSDDPFADPGAALEEDVAPRRSGASPPQRKLTRARTPGADRIVGVVALVVALGAAIFFGWRFLAPTVGGSGEPEITMPPLDQELFPRMRQLAGRASTRMAADMLALPERGAVPEEPSEDWLAGIYLAGASGYPNVPAYWSAIRDWVEATQIQENALFREALRAQLDTANLAASDSEAIRDRALAGFQAAGSDRRVVYDQMREVAERSLELHEFLLANEESITYEPAGSGVSRDPVLEAVPASEALGDEMWERVGSITNAMDALGYLDRIDTERLIGVFLEKLEATAIR